MKNFNHKINFLFHFSVIVFIIANFLHFLIIHKEKKEAQAAGVLSIAGVTVTSIPCTSSSPCPSCSTGLTMVQITQRFGGDILSPPVLCLPPTGLPLLNGRSLLSPGTTFMGGFTSVGPTGVVQAGMAGSY